MGRKCRDLVWEESKQKSSHKLTMLALAERANDQTGQCNPSHETLADMVGVTTRQIRKILDDLVTAGEIEIVTGRGRNHTNQYNILLQNRNCSSDYVLENRNSSVDKIGTPARKIGTLASENRNYSSYEPLEPIEPTTEPRERDHAPARTLVPHKPRFSSNSTSSKTAQPPVQTDSPHIDPRHFVNGYIPSGQGSTPVEIFYERNSIREHTLSAPLEDDICREVKDLDRWRSVVVAWQGAGHKPLNITGQLDWYRKDIPTYTNGAQNGKPSNHHTDPALDVYAAFT